MNMFFSILIVLMPWRIKRLFLIRFWGYKLHVKSWIGFSWVFPAYLEMESGSSISHLVVAVNLDRMLIGAKSTIGRFTWVTGCRGSEKVHFGTEMERRSEFLLGCHSAVTKWHHIDCTNRVVIGDYSTIAGYYSQFLTHSIDVRESIQCSRPIVIGDYCFIGTNVVMLGGASVANRTIVGAKSLVNRSFQRECVMVCGVPASIKADLSADYKYFNRDVGYVD